MYFLSLGSVPQLSGAITPILEGNAPIFGGTATIFGGTATIFGGNASNLGGGIENVPREQRNSATCPKSLNLLPKTKCVITAIRQPKEVSLLCYSSTG